MGPEAKLLSGSRQLSPGVPKQNYEHSRNVQEDSDSSFPAEAPASLNDRGGPSFIIRDGHQGLDIALLLAA